MLAPRKDGAKGTGSAVKSSEKGGEISARGARAGRRESGATGEIGKQETLSRLESRAKSAFQASIVPLAGVSRAASWNPRAFEPLANTRQSRESPQPVRVCAYARSQEPRKHLGTLLFLSPRYLRCRIASLFRPKTLVRSPVRREQINTPVGRPPPPKETVRRTSFPQNRGASGSSGSVSSSREHSLAEDKESRDGGRLTWPNFLAAR